MLVNLVFRLIIAEGIVWHKRKFKPFVVKGNSIAGYGIYASRDIHEGEIILKAKGDLSESLQKRFVEKNWNEDEKCISAGMLIR